MKPSLFDLVALAEAHQFVRLAAILGAPVETVKDSRKGSAPPRKRPRRVFMKLDARGFRAHYAGTAEFASLQRKTTWLHLHKLPRESHSVTRYLRVQLAPLLLREGRLQPAPVADDCPAESITLAPIRPVVNGPDWRTRSRPVATEREVYKASRYLSEADVMYPAPVTLSVGTLVYAMEGPDVEAALEPLMVRVLQGFALAAHHPADAKIISRQTSYRY